MNGRRKRKDDTDFKRLEYLSDVINKQYYNSAAKLKNCVIIDTDILIGHLRGVEKAKKFLIEVENGKYSAFISIITKVELLSGREDERILELFEILNVAPLSDDVIFLAGDLRRMYKIPIPDALIAATAITLDAEIITRNLKHYGSIEELVIKEIG